MNYIYLLLFAYYPIVSNNFSGATSTVSMCCTCRAGGPSTAAAGSTEQDRVCILKAMGASIGCLFVMLSLLFLIIGIVLAAQNGNEFSVPWVISWIESYVVGFFLNLMFQFNPFSIVLKLREAMDRPLFLYLSRIVGLGTWQAEREVALAAYKKNAGAVSSIRGDGFGALGQHDDDDVAEDQCGGEIVAAAVGVHSVDVELAPVVADRLP